MLSVSGLGVSGRKGGATDWGLSRARARPSKPPGCRSRRCRRRTSSRLRAAIGAFNRRDEDGRSTGSWRADAEIVPVRAVIEGTILSRTATQRSQYCAACR